MPACNSADRVASFVSGLPAGAEEKSSLRLPAPGSSADFKPLRRVTHQLADSPRVRTFGLDKSPLCWRRLPRRRRRALTVEGESTDASRYSACSNVLLIHRLIYEP